MWRIGGNGWLPTYVNADRLTAGCSFLSCSWKGTAYTGVNPKSEASMRIFFWEIAVFALSALLCVAQTTTASSTEVIDLNFEGRPVDLLKKIAEQNKIVIGIAGVMSTEDDRSVKIIMSKGTLKQVFDDLARQAPRLSWTEAKDGAIHFHFNNSEFGLMKVQVNKLRLNDPARWGISNALAQIPEVKDWLDKQNCDFDELIAGKPPKDWGLFSIDASNVAFESVLDEIARKSKLYYWSVIQYSAEPCHINYTP